jgi:hypothetical protein
MNKTTKNVNKRIELLHLSVLFLIIRNVDDPTPVFLSLQTAVPGYCRGLNWQYLNAGNHIGSGS